MAAQPLTGWGAASAPVSGLPVSVTADEPARDVPGPAAGRPDWRWGRQESSGEEPDHEHAALLHDLLTVLLPLVASVALGGLFMGLALHWAI